MNQKPIYTKRIAFVDVDGVCADLLKTWLNCYNHDYDDNLVPQDILSWDLGQYVKPVCGLKIYDYLKDGRIYDYVDPIRNALAGVSILREKGWRVVFPTTTPIETPFRKFYWLEEHGFKPEKRDYLEIDDKSLLSAGNDNLLFDDGTHNVLAFTGFGILFSQPNNLKDNYPFRVRDWDEIMNLEIL
jgi:5'-nucleotidase